MTLFESIAKKLVGTRPAAPGTGVIDVITPTSNKKQKKAGCAIL